MTLSSFLSIIYLIEPSYLLTVEGVPHLTRFGDRPSPHADL
jgi:hypothetical protein